MGTTWSARVVQLAEARQLQGGLQRQLDAIVAEISHWEAESDLGRFNRTGACTWHTLPEAFFHVLNYALAVARATGGACDPCAGELVNLWGFGPTARYDEAGFTPPSRSEVALARERIAARRVELDPARRRAFQPGGIQLDLSAVAKGYGVDALALWLEGQGVRDYLVEVGGELRGAGVKPDGQPWWVSLETPAAGIDEIAVALHGLSVATSGDYRRFFLRGEQRFPHTIDPRSGAPITNDVASVTVVHEQAMAADAWSTALTVLGEEAGLRLAEQHGLAARFLLREGAALREAMSSRFLAMLDDE
ncbi:FAD:protein FMN transferase [Pseudoduganella sp. UC29_106]|uniref:FAD:protein FMN transferase n=1 Tax=Pseudoduganella sp. UC29_106 TaxID=3374553 RepID=UPI0037564591